MSEQLQIYFNTNKVRGEKLKEVKIRVGSQNEKILSFFRRHPDMSFTPFEVQRYLLMGNTPITSIRRAITALTKLGYLRRTDTVKEEYYGQNNHTWILNRRLY